MEYDFRKAILEHKRRWKEDNLVSKRPCAWYDLALWHLVEKSETEGKPLGLHVVEQVGTRDKLV